MKKDNEKKDSRKVKHCVIGALWKNRRNGTGVEFFKIQITVNDQLINISAWPNQRKNHPLSPDYLVYAQELPE